MKGLRKGLLGCGFLWATSVLLGLVQTEVGDPTRGKEVFEKRCTGCHALEQNREGPHLRGVYGRISGTVAGFPYSQALVQARIPWDESSLERWLADPDILVPGNNMGFHVASPLERKDLIQFLKQASQ